MARKKKKRDEADADVPIAAMIDVVFLLLIYFIVTIKTTIDQAWVAVNLPGPPAEPPPETPPPPIDIFVQSDSYIYMNGQKSLDDMEGTLRNIKAMNNEDVMVNIKVSLKARHHKLVDLLDLLSKVGLKNFNLHSLKGPVSH